MKRLAAILFLAVILFNLCGYHMLIDYFQSQNDHQFQARLDNNKYEDKDLIYIKLPVNLPYYSNSKDYEKINGSIEVGGIEYKYVKRRVYNDTIELACIPNFSKKQFQSVKYDFLRLNNDWQSTYPGKKTTNSLKIILPEFCSKPISFIISPFVMDIKKEFVSPSFILSVPFKKVQEQPPESIQGSI